MSLRNVLLTSKVGRRTKIPLQRTLGRIGYELVPRRLSEDQLVRELIGRHGVTMLIDVGANQGQYARRFRDQGFQGKILSFEPIADAFALLARAAKSDELWETRQLALDRYVGRGLLNVSANSVSSSLLTMEKLHEEAEPTSRVVRSEEVSISTLDAELGASTETKLWMKLDVQGGEMRVLDGGAGVISRCQVIQCEVSLRPLYRGQPSYLDVLNRLDVEGLYPVFVIPGFSDRESGEMYQLDVIAARAAV